MMIELLSMVSIYR